MRTDTAIAIFGSPWTRLIFAAFGALLITLLIRAIASRPPRLVPARRLAIPRAVTSFSAFDFREFVLAMLVYAMFATPAMLFVRRNHTLLDMFSVRNWLSPNDWQPISPTAIFLCAGITYALNVLYLSLFHRLTVMTARVGTLFLMSALIVFLSVQENQNPNLDSIPFLILMLPFILPCLLAFALPGSPLSTFPLIPVYLALGVFPLPELLSGLPLYCPLAALAGWSLPRCHRILSLWRAPALPHLPSRSRGGMTLIELLIVVAMLAIFSAGIRNMAGTTRRAFSRAQDRQAAIALSNEQLARLRSQLDLPAPGTYPFDPDLIQHNPTADQSRYIIAPGPNAALRQCTFELKLRHDLQDYDLQLAVLLSAAQP